MNMKAFIIFLFAAALTFTSCQKTPDYINMPYKCYCGSITWDGTTFEVLGAEYVLITDETSRKYFVTSEISPEGALEVQHINFELEIDDVLVTEYDLADTPLNMSIKEVDYNSALVKREYAPIGGTVTLLPAPFGGPESVTFNLIVRQVIDGDFFGPEIPYSGTFDLTIEL